MSTKFDAKVYIYTTPCEINILPNLKYSICLPNLKVKFMLTKFQSKVDIYQGQLF